MTTPEKFRRRQRIEGAAVTVIGALLLAQAWYFQNQDEEQRDCIRDQVQSVVNTLTARSGLAQRESDNTARVLIAAADADAETNFQSVLDRYKREQEAITAARDANPIKYPTGTCELMDPSTFFYIKGCVALAATVLLIWHTWTVWPHIPKLGQRLRYGTLAVPVAAYHHSRPLSRRRRGSRSNHGTSDRCSAWPCLW